MNSTSAPVRFLTRNTGTLPVTISSIGLASSPSMFHIETTECTTGRVLAPNETCASDLVYRPTTSNTHDGTLIARYGASDIVETNRRANDVHLRGQGLAAKASTVDSHLFGNGFEGEGQAPETACIAW